MAGIAGMEILIIGGSRFVGPVLAERLLREGCAVSVLNRGTRRAVDGAKLFVADRKDSAQMKDAVKQMPLRFDAIIDTCSYNRQDSEIAYGLLSSRTDRWAHFSSAAVYKETGDWMPVETDLIGSVPIWGDYGRGKSAADLFLFEQAQDKCVTILRPPYIYGPGNYLDRETFVWSRALRGRPVIVPGEGKALAHFIHVEELVDAFIAVLRERRETGIRAYNVAPDEPVTLRDYVRLLAEIAGVPDTGVVAPESARGLDTDLYFPFFDYPCVVNSQRIKDELGWSARYGFVGGHRQTFSTHDPEALKTLALNIAAEDGILAKIGG